VQRNSMFNLSEPLGEKAEGTADVHEEVTALRDLVTHARTEVSRTRHRLEQRQEEIDSHLRRTNALSILVIVCIVAVSSMVWFGLPLLREKEELSIRLSAMQALIDSVQGRLSSLESNPPPASQNSADFRNPPAENKPVPAVLTPQPKAASLSLFADDAVARRRIDFKLSRNRTEEVAPGIYLTVRTADVERQRIDGWIQIADDGRTVFIRDQATEAVTSFATRHDDRFRKLVFTKVDKYTVAGYVLVPTASTRS
jgi:hypothetical protein